MSVTDDRAAFMAADEFPLTLADGIVIDVHDDPEGYLSAGEDEPADMQYVGITVDDPGTDMHESLWSIGIPEHMSGHAVRAMLWDGYLTDTSGYALLLDCRLHANHERAEAAEWAARDTVTR